MGKVNTSRFGGSSEYISPSDIEEGGAVVTLASYEEVEITDKDGKVERISPVVTFEEFGEDKVLWLNRTMAEVLVEQLGDESEGWLGKKVAIDSYIPKFRGKTYDPKVRISPVEMWTVIFKGAGVKLPTKAAAAAPAKRSGKR